MFDRLSAACCDSAQTGRAMLKRVVVVAMVVLGSLAMAQPARAQSRGPEALEFVDQINTRFGLRGGIESADAVLFPAIMAMDPRPASIPDLESASLLVPGERGWEAVAQWAEAPAQQAVIEAVKTITDTQRRFRFVLPYSTAGVEQDRIEAGLVVDLGPLNLLVSARFNYLNRLDDVAALLSVEATRLAAAGEAEEALNVLNAWMWLGRIVIERGMSLEKYWGFGTMIVAMERMRDVVYVFHDQFKIEDIAKQLNRMLPKDLRFDQLELPEGDRIAAKQLVARTMTPNGGIVAARFAATMGFIEAEGREMMVYDKAAFYRAIAAGHAGHQATNEKIDALFGGWQSRWQITNPNDDLLKFPSDFMRMDRREFYALMVVLSDIEWLYPLRHVLWQELQGTQTALGLAGYYARHKVWPPRISSISPNPLPRPGGMTPLWVDYFNWNKRFERFEDMRYFVPGRDQPEPEFGGVRAHEILVVGGSLFELFSHGRPDDIGLAAAQLGSSSQVGTLDFYGDDASVDGEDSPVDGDSSVDGGEAPPFGGFGSMVGLGPLAGIPVEIPDDLFDVDNLQLNANSLRNFLLKVSEADPAVEEDAAEFAEWVRGLQEEMGFNPLNAEAEAPRAIRQKLTVEPARSMLSAAGVEVPRLSQALEGVVRAIAAGPKAKEAIQLAMNNEVVPPALLDQAVVEAINAACQSQYLDPLVKVGVAVASKELGGEEELKQMIRGFIGSQQILAQSGINQITGATLERYTASIGSDQFILYSVGADGSNGQARRVGLGGNDILYWPPLLSLKREYLQNPGW